jgi:hypothetical protein
MKRFGTVKVECVVADAGATATWLGDDAGWLRGQKNHTPAAQSRHSKIQYVARERIKFV